MKYARREGEEVKTQEAFYETNPAWNSAKRFTGSLNWSTLKTRNEKPETIYERVDSKKEAEYVASQAHGTITKFEEVPEERRTPTPFDVADIQKLEELERIQHEMLEPVYGSEVIAEMKRRSPVEAFRLELAYQKGVGGLETRARTLGKGGEDLRWFDNHIQWIKDSSNCWSKRLYQAENRSMLMQKEFADRPDLRQQLTTHMESMLNPDPAFGSMMRKANTAWFMGGNLATAVVNGFQIPTRGVSQMTLLTGNPVDSYRRMKDAFGEVFSLANRDVSKLTPDRRWLQQQMKKDGIASVWTEESMIGEDNPVEKFREAISREKEYDKTWYVRQGGAKFLHYMMAPFRMVEKANVQAAAYMGFDYWKPRIIRENPGMSNEGGEQGGLRQGTGI